MTTPRDRGAPPAPADPRPAERDRARRVLFAWRKDRDFGGMVARGLCFLFALIGLVPLALGVLARVPVVRAWAARETSRLLAEHVRVQASYGLRIQPWPLQVAIEDLRVEANDGGGPFLTAKSIIIHPRLFALLDGKLDMGEVRVDEPKLRAVLVAGKLKNLDFELPESDSGTTSGQTPLSALSLSDGEIDLSLDDVRVRVQQADLDITVDESSDSVAATFAPNPLELSLRAGAIAVDRREAGAWGERIDEDAICNFQLRARLGVGELIVRRLELEGAADLDPDADTRPSCGLDSEDWRHVHLRAAALRVALDDSGIAAVDGRVMARVPVPIVHRFTDIAPTTGWIELDADSFVFERGQRLPRFHGRALAASLGIHSKMIADRLEANVDVNGERIKATDIALSWGGGVATIAEAVVRPFESELPLAATGVVVRGVSFPALFDAVGGNPNAHVNWLLDKVSWERFAGTLSPLALAGPMVAETRDFVVYDRPVWQHHKRQILAIPSATITGGFEVNEPGILLNRLAITLPNSRLNATVDLQFDEVLGVTVFPGSTVDLKDVSPLADVDLSGVAQLELEAGGRFTKPLVTGKVSLDKFVVEGFPVGKLAGRVAFAPLKLELAEGTLVHGKSAVRVGALVLDFDSAPANLMLTAKVDTRDSGLHLADFLEMIRLDHDPRFANMRALAKGTAQASYVFGGPKDACGGGRLEVASAMQLSLVELFGQSFDSGSVELDYRWDDIPAGSHGLMALIHAATLKKGGGTIVGRGTVRHDAEVEGDFTVTAMPLWAIDALGLSPHEKSVTPDGTVSAIARLSGTLQRLRGEFDVALSTVRIGPATLPASRVRVTMVPENRPVKYLGQSECGHRLVEEISEATSPASEDSASFQVSKGRLFGGQLVIDDLLVTRGARPMLKEGTVKLDKLDLGALANILPGVAYSASAPRGHLSAELHLEHVPLDAPALGDARAHIEEFEISRDGATLRVGKVSQAIELSAETLKLPSLPLTFTPREGLAASFTVSGRIEELSQSPTFDVTATLRPIDLAKLTEKFPFVSRARGLVHAELHLGGPYFLPRLTGDLSLDRGMVRFSSFGLPLDDVNLKLAIRDNEIVIKEANARAGGSGQLSLTGRVPLRGFGIAEANATLAARDVALPLADGVKATANALFTLSYQPELEGDPSAALPHVAGTVSLTHFTYARPIAFRVDLNQLTGKRKTEVETYDPKGDLFAFDVNVVSPRPLRIANNLIDATLEVNQPGLRLVGTNQRFGARGTLNLEPSSKLFIQGHDFRVREGRIEFDNPARVTPRLDVVAETELRRYASSADTQVTSATDTASASSGGNWRIRMHATGDTESPQLQLSSDPPLSQDDIVLLLQIGMTRAELDRGLATSLAQSVSLEALSALTGFDQALRKTVPLIDEFRLGSQYSSRTGRPEPTVSVGKRITDDVRATVTSGLSDNREVRSNVEWQLSRGVSVQSSYDNVNDVSSSAIGNLGADLRWRLEFE